MRILAVVQKVKKTVFDAQFVSSAVDSTGNFTVSNVNGVTFSGGNAVWVSQSPAAYLETNEEGFTLGRKLTVTVNVNVATGILAKPIWTIINAGLDSNIRLVCITTGVGQFSVQANGQSVLTADVYTTGTFYTVKVELYLSGLVNIFVNGGLAATATVPVFTPVNRKLYIGYNPVFTTFGFQGSMNFLTVEEG